MQDREKRSSSATGYDDPWQALPSKEDEQKLSRGWISDLLIAGGLTALIVVGITTYNANLAKAGGTNPAIEQKGRDYIAAQLLDPAAAQFQAVSVSNRCVTGKVNGKNSFGAYTGFHDFYYDDARGVGQQEPSPGLEIGEPDHLKSLLTRANFTNAYRDCLAGHRNDPAYGKLSKETAQ